MSDFVDVKEGSRPPIAVSSDMSKIFYSNEFMGQSADDLWPAASGKRVRRSTVSPTDHKPVRDLLAHRASRLIILDVLKKRRRNVDDPCIQSKRLSRIRLSVNRKVLPNKGKSPHDTELNGKKPFQRFKPTASDEKTVGHRLDADPVLRTYVAGKSDTPASSRPTRDVSG